MPEGAPYNLNQAEVGRALQQSLCMTESRFVAERVLAVRKQVKLAQALLLAKSGPELTAEDGDSSHIDPGTALTQDPWTTLKAR